MVGFTPGTTATYIQRTEDRLRDLSEVSVEVTSATFETGSGSASIRIEIGDGESIDPTGSQIRALVYEDDIIACCDPEGQDEWDYIVRKVLPDTPLTASQSQEVQTIDLDFDLDPTWVADNLTIVAWVQRDSDQYIWNAGKAAGVPADAPTDLPARSQSVVLFQNAPNPVADVTSIGFELMQDGPVIVSIFDVAGREVRRLVDDTLTAGEHAIRWDGTDKHGLALPNGAYLYRVRFANGDVSRGLRLLR